MKNTTLTKYETFSGLIFMASLLARYLLVVIWRASKTLYGQIERLLLFELWPRYATEYRWESERYLDSRTIILGSIPGYIGESVRVNVWERSFFTETRRVRTERNVTRAFILDLSTTLYLTNTLRLESMVITNAADIEEAVQLFVLRIIEKRLE